jgi:hypothetical protein
MAARDRLEINVNFALGPDIKKQCKTEQRIGMENICSSRPMDRVVVESPTGKN